ncbi:21260_t:CDS:1, partial [Dentiscutata erythropus]
QEFRREITWSSLNMCEESGEPEDENNEPENMNIDEAYLLDASL